MRAPILAVLLAAGGAAAVPPPPAATPTPRGPAAVKPDPPRFSAEAAPAIADGLSKLNAELKKGQALQVETSLAAVSRARSAALTPAAVRRGQLLAEVRQIREKLKTASPSERDALGRRVAEILGEARTGPRPSKIRPE
jgi:hypothetical protein